ncbi:MAG: tRNA pseudouridine(38-40) synthase TruA [Planctomycetota bacterium]
MRNIKLVIHYDGSSYHGWQLQPGQATIQGEITRAISRLMGREVLVNGASRTDAGVNALGQVANIRVDTPIPTKNIAKALTEMLPDDIAVAEAVDVPDEFDAISSTKSKLYRYTIYTGPTPPVLQIRQCWHIPRKLDVDAMHEAAGLLVGKKDFKSFASAADTRQSSVRTITNCLVKTDGERTYIDVEADGFLYNMVRNIAGALVEVGRGRWKPEKMTEIIEAKNRTAAGPIAPAAGLCLMRIDY